MPAGRTDARQAGIAHAHRIVARERELRSLPSPLEHDVAAGTFSSHASLYPATALFLPTNIVVTIIARVILLVDANMLGRLDVVTAYALCVSLPSFPDFPLPILDVA